MGEALENFENIWEEISGEAGKFKRFFDFWKISLSLKRKTKIN
jgi:hypothetical protein